MTEATYRRARAREELADAAAAMRYAGDRLEAAWRLLGPPSRLPGDTLSVAGLLRGLAIGVLKQAADLPEADEWAGGAP